MKNCLILFFSLALFQVLAQPSLLDARDGNRYRTVKLGNLHWMAEDLRFFAEGSKCLEDCGSIRFYDYQYLDTVCPEGWRLPEMDEWDDFVNTFENVEKVRMMEGNAKLYRVDFLDKFNLFENNILYLRAYGRIEGDALDKGNFVDYWTVNPATDGRFHMHFTPYSVVGHSHKHHLKPQKVEDYRLFPVRCVCEAERRRESIN